MKKFFVLFLAFVLFLSIFPNRILSDSEKKEKKESTPTFDERWPEDIRAELTPVAHLTITGSVPTTTTSSTN
jgi:hypothetical protein